MSDSFTRLLYVAARWLSVGFVRSGFWSESPFPLSTALFFSSCLGKKCMLPTLFALYYQISVCWPFYLVSFALRCGGVRGLGFTAQDSPLRPLNTTNSSISLVEKCTLLCLRLLFLRAFSGSFLCEVFLFVGVGLLWLRVRLGSRIMSVPSYFSRSCRVGGIAFARFTTPSDCFSDSLLA